MADRDQIENWAQVRDKHTAVLEFVSWLEGHYGIRLDYDGVSPERPAPLQISKLVDEFFEVDQARLEQERRQLLDEIRKDGRN